MTLKSTGAREGIQGLSSAGRSRRCAATCYRVEAGLWQRVGEVDRNCEWTGAAWQALASNGGGLTITRRLRWQACQTSLQKKQKTLGAFRFPTVRRSAVGGFVSLGMRGSPPNGLGGDFETSWSEQLCPPAVGAHHPSNLILTNPIPPRYGYPDSNL